MTSRMKKNAFTVLTLSALISLSTTVETPLAKTQTPPALPPPLDDTIIVAVIDTGIDISHPMVQSFLWKNPGESGVDDQGRDRATNGIDDDGNGFVDDVHGWNFVGDSKNIKDTHGHGTHIAGLITKNLPITSQVKIMVLKYYDSDATESQTLNASNRALRYALSNGAKVINYSGGGDLPSAEERNLFAQAQAKGVFTVAASGNDGRSTDIQGFYPASYDYPNMVSVGSTTSDGELLPSSNRGPNSVDVAAPGLDVLSALPGKGLGKLTGTSQATAQVTGVLAALMENSPHLSATELKSRLIQTGAVAQGLEGQTRFARIPDFERATRMRDANELDPAKVITASKVKEVFDEPLDW